MTTLPSNLLLSFKILIYHLWLSISSVKFYENVFRNYKGYGAKYILTLSFIASFFCSVLLLSEAGKLKEYLDNNIISKNTVNIDHIINQIPVIEYDGQKITTQDSIILFLYGIDNKKIVAIDPENNLTQSDITKIPFILRSNKLIMNTIDTRQNIHKTIFMETIKYQEIFGNHKQTITQEEIKSKLSEIINKSSIVIIILIFPILGLAIFIKTLMDQAIIIIIAYAITFMFKAKIALKSCIRTVLFSAGVPALFTMLVKLMIVFNFFDFSIILEIVQLLANLLMIVGVWRTSNNFSLKN